MTIWTELLDIRNHGRMGRLLAGAFGGWADGNRPGTGSGMDLRRTGRTRAGQPGGEPPRPAQAPPPDTKPCPRCDRGSVTGPNGEHWRCHYCNGTGRIQTPTYAPDTPPRKD